MKAWLRRHRLVVSISAVALFVPVGVLFYSYLQFDPSPPHACSFQDYEYETAWNLAKGQVLKVCFDMPDADQEAIFVAVVRSVADTTGGIRYAGPILKDCPRVRDGDIIRFRAPHSGRYMLTVTGRGLSAWIAPKFHISYDIDDWPPRLPGL